MGLSLQSCQSLSHSSSGPIIVSRSFMCSFPRRDDVERANQSRMHSLTGNPQTYFANDGGTIADADQRAKLLSNMMAPTHLQLKINSQVMLIKNTDETLVNGSMGHVLGFFDPATYAKNIAGVAEEQDKKGKKKDSAPLGVQVYPLVRFPIPGTNTFREVLVQPETWKVELPSGEVQASRTQVRVITPSLIGSDV
jgi:ATP-dependent DNA helicase PIF1